jgi:hypothetical protein
VQGLALALVQEFQVEREPELVLELVQESELGPVQARVVDWVPVPD